MGVNQSNVRIYAQGIFAGIVIGVSGFLFDAALDLYPGIDGRERQFREQEERWNWQLLDQRKTCRRKEKLVACTSFVDVTDGAFGQPRQKLVAWVCTPAACTWLLEP